VTNDAYLIDVRRTFRNYRALAEAAIAQVSDEQLGAALGDDDNSIAVIMRHVAGNIRSRFSAFLASDGEKPDRDRDAEFVAPSLERAALMQQWDAAWTVLVTELDTLSPADLDRTIRIRGEAFTVPEAFNRSMTHTAYHVGQIVFLAKHLAGPGWKSLSIPKGQSRAHATGWFKERFVQPPR
jgi:uncharacterized damage-inducible protein DinB